MTVPEHILPGLLRYRDHHTDPGGFLLAVLENDLMEAFARADEINREGMFYIVEWIANNMPHSAYGNKKLVAQWLAQKEII